MLYKYRSRCLASIGMLLLLLCQDRSARGDDLKEWNRLFALCVKQTATGRFDEAERSVFKLKEIAEGPFSDEPACMGHVLSLRGNINLCRGDYATAESFFARSLEIFSSSLGKSHPNVALAHMNLGVTYRKQGKETAAGRSYERALAIQEELIKEDASAESIERSGIIDTLSNLGVLRQLQGRDAEAVRVLERALTYSSECGNETSSAEAGAHSNLGGLLNKLERYSEAIAHFEQALAIRKKIHGQENIDYALTLNNLAAAHFYQEQYDKAEPLYLQALTICDKLPPTPESERITTTWSDKLASICEAQGRFADAESLHRRLLAHYERADKRDNTAVAMSLNNVGYCCYMQAEYDDAEQMYKRALALRERIHGKDHPEVATVVGNLGTLYSAQGRLADAEEFHKRALRIQEDTLPRNDPRIALSLNNLADVYRILAQYRKAEPLYERARSIFERSPGRNSFEYAMALNNLGVLHSEVGNYATAADFHQQALKIREKLQGASHPDVALSSHNLATVYLDEGRDLEAKKLFERALKIYRDAGQGAHPNIAPVLDLLGNVYVHLGQYADAEALLREAFVIRQSALDPGHIQVATSYNNLATIATLSGRYEDACALSEKALAIQEDVLGGDHPEIARTLNAIGGTHFARGSFAEAEPYLTRALSIREKAGSDEQIAESLNNLGTLHGDLGHFEDAIRLHERALSIRRNAGGGASEYVGQSLVNLAIVYRDQKQYAAAEPLIDEAITLFDDFQAKSGWKNTAHLVRSDIRMRQGRPDAALADIRTAMQQANEVRKQMPGVAHQRATAFGQFASAFEKMVEFQTDVEDLPQAFAAIESFRAQSLQDLMHSAGVALLEGVPEDNATRLLRAESDAKAEVAALQKQLDVMRIRSDMDDGEKVQETRRLAQALEEAHGRLVQAWADIKNASPAYRMIVTEDREPVKLEVFQEELSGSGTLALQYMLGQDNGFLLAYGGGIEPVLSKLDVKEAQATTLGCKAGPLTAAQVRQILLGNDDRPGLLQELTNRNQIEDDGLPSEEIIKQLNTLWTVLVPDETLREKLADGEALQRLLILPDGILARLPFEALVVNDDPVNPEYLIDNGPATMYAPSATVFYNLKHRKLASSEGETLTVGNPRYGGDGEPGDRGDVLDELKTASRFAHLGTLAELPWTGDESRWIKESCDAKGLPVVQLTQESATEAKVRQNVAGRSLVHLASHGMADGSHGNLFGALALTPVDAGDTSNDGFLTVAEMFDLDLHACELAILSACDTNIGPNQRGEGTWSMCRGMLTSGARRVVTTDWQVADEASAHLVYAFVYYLHDSESQARDHAECLRNARLSIRNHDTRQWRHPYFWAPFVLTGPE